jgi:hypothetical protein
VASIAAVLPVQLQSFMVQRSGNASAGLTWKTDAQYVCESFTIQRSADGANFRNIGQVNGETGKTTYNYTDNTPGSGTFFYRLQIKENDKIVYTPIQSLTLTSANKLQLRPSATSGVNTNVYVHLSKQAMVNLYISDITGKIYHRRSLNLDKGEHLLPLWIGNLGKGVYYVHVKDEHGNANVLPMVKW